METDKNNNIYEYDFAILYFGLTRSLKNNYKSHQEHFFDILNKNGLSYRVFVHTWKTKNEFINWKKINNSSNEENKDYNLLNPYEYKIESQDEFIDNVNFSDFFYENLWNINGHNYNGEWIPQLIKNHLCALESKKRGFEMIEENIKKENIKYKNVIFIRPDVEIYDDLPLSKIIFQEKTINIPNKDHYEGYNDRFAIMKYEDAHFYGKRINEIAEFRKNNGRIVSEKYVKFIIKKYNLQVNEIKFDFEIKRHA